MMSMTAVDKVNVDRVNGLYDGKPEEYIAAYHRAIRLDAFAVICPEHYHAIDAEKYPGPSKAALAHVRAWSGWLSKPRRGLLLIGPPRTGKTFAAWEAVQRAMLRGASARAFTSAEWHTWAHTNVRDGCLAPAVADLSWFRIVFVDDIFKGAMSDAQELALYALAERCLSGGPALIATSNATGKDMMALSTGGGASRMESIIARIRECCDVVTFGKG